MAVSIIWKPAFEKFESPIQIKGDLQESLSSPSTDIESTYLYRDSKISRPKDVFFFLSYGLLLSFMVFETSFFSIYIYSVWKIVFIVSFVLLFTYEIMCEQARVVDIRNAIIICLLACFVTSVAIGPAENSITATLFFIFFGRRIPFHRVAKFSLIVSAFCIAVIVSSAHFGIITNYIEYGGRIREYLGFKYSLFGPMLVANCTNLCIYIRKRNISVLELLMLSGINYWFFLKTNSRLSFGLTLLLLFVALLMKIGGISFFYKSLVRCCMVFSFIISAILSFALTVFYNPASLRMYTVNSVFGNRLQLGKTSLLQYGINLFGNKNMVFVGNGLDMYGNKSTGIYNYVDCLYIQVIQKYGIVFFLIVLIAITYALYKSCLAGDIYYLIIMTFIAGHCIIDNLPLCFYYNTFWLGLGPLLLGYEKVSIQNERTQQRINHNNNQMYT